MSAILPVNGRGGGRRGSPPSSVVVPLNGIASYFARVAEHLIIEFVSKSDPKVKILLATREDVFPTYTQEGFEEAFSNAFEIVDAHAVKGSERTIYLMRRRA